MTVEQYKKYLIKHYTTAIKVFKECKAILLEELNLQDLHRLLAIWNNITRDLTSK